MIFLIYLFYIDRIFTRHSEAANICEYLNKNSPLCCSGWIKNVYGDCVKSECDYDCGYGKCVGLNVCECHDKTVRSEPCPKTDYNLCLNRCSDKGECVDGKCICESGYSGEDCSITIISTCFVKTTRGLCKSTPESLQLSKNECCAMFQAAWGNPCVFCPRNTFCPRGYILKNGQCEDIDECQFKSICLNGECINEKGSFKCNCPPDYAVDENTMSCYYQKDQCLTYSFKCGIYGRCVPTSDGSYRCMCMKPYEASDDGKRCIKNSVYNVCKFSTKLCLPYGECQSHGLSYICNCLPGFHQSVDRKSCSANTKDDICQSSKISEKCLGGKCISFTNGYRCECYGDYIGYNNDQECVRRITLKPRIKTLCSIWEYYSLCQGGECIDRNNDYYCKCLNGYLAVDGGRRCEKNVNTNKDQCKKPEIYEKCRGGKCISLANEYRCECYGDYISINNNQECVKDSPKKLIVKSFCSISQYYSMCQGGECIDGNNDYYCKCLNGYRLVDNGRKCERNVVTISPIVKSLCSIWKYYSMCQGGECIDRNGDYYCKCLNGFRLTENGRKCEKNEERTKLTKAPFKSYCHIEEYSSRCKGGGCIDDTIYGFKCICLDGFTASTDGRSCEPMNVDICLINGHKCKQGRCLRNGINDYQCICPPSSKTAKDGKSCIDYHTTSTSPNHCDIESNRQKCMTGDCIPDKQKGFKCICKSNYKVSEDGKACYKIEAILTLCSRHQLQCQGGGCMELDEFHYECQCLQGFRKSLDGKSCIKNDEKPPSPCSIHYMQCQGGTCVDIDSSNYQCHCLNGFTKSEDGKACEKIIERIIPSLCSKYQSRCNGGSCVELSEFNYECRCLEGFSKSIGGRSCIKNENRIIQSMCSKYQSRCNGGSCIELSEFDYECRCLKGFSKSQDGKSCIKDENRSIKSMCSQYHSQCYGGSCIDLSEFNYECRCLEGFSKSQDGRFCFKSEKITIPSVCSKYQSKCNGGSCIELSEFDYECRCVEGFSKSQDGRSCIKNEKRIIKSMCSQYHSQCYGGSCIDLSEFNYECQCLEGFSKSQDGRSCFKSEHRILQSVCFKYQSRCSGGGCVELNDTDYECRCLDGFTKSEDRKWCIKAERIIVQSMCSQYHSQCNGGSCIDLSEFNYECRCLEGFSKSQGGRSCIKNENRIMQSMCSQYGGRCNGGRCIDLNRFNYECRCLKGFRKSQDGKSCNKIGNRFIKSMCTQYQSRCNGGSCIELGGLNYECQCLVGFTKSRNSRSCIKNENRIIPSMCSKYQSQCNGGNCIDLSEFNYECRCLEGFAKVEDGRSCIKVEKVQMLSACEVHCQGGSCIELDNNNYECRCFQGFLKSPDGKSCIKNHENFLSICQRHRNDCLTGVCYPISQNDYICLCVDGYRQSYDKRACVKTTINTKCAQNQHRCQGGYCFDVTNGYICICTEQFVASDDGRDCLSKNETLKTHIVNGIFYLSPITKTYCQAAENAKCHPGKCIDEKNGYRCECHHSFKVSMNKDQCIRDMSVCPHCLYGCSNNRNISTCLCPEKYENLNDTGLCIEKSKSLTHSLGVSTCNSQAENKTVVIRFNGLSNESTENSVILHKTISAVLLVKQERSIRLNFCVPIKKREQLPRLSRRQITADLFKWQVVCIFYC